MTDPVATTRATYDTIAQRYAERPERSPEWLTAELAWLRGGLPAGARVADVGCGPGHYTLALREQGFEAVGLDLSHGMLTALGVPGLVRADMRALPLADRSLDAVWCAAALLHVPRADVPAVLAGFARALRAGGLLHLTVAEGDGEVWEPVSHGLPHPRYYVLHRLDALSALLSAASFTVIDVARRSTGRDWITIHATQRLGSGCR